MVITAQKADFNPRRKRTMPQIETKESAVRLPDVHEVEDPREIAAELTFELAELTAEKLRLNKKPGGASRVGCKMTAIEYQILRVYSKLDRLANHGRTAN